MADKPRVILDLCGGTGRIAEMTKTALDAKRSSMDDQERVKFLDENCHVCGIQLTSWDARCSKALAYKHKTCERCIASEYGKEPGELREQLEAVFGLRPCMGI
jgi:hypothetical protein